MQKLGHVSYQQLDL